MIVYNKVRCQCKEKKKTLLQAFVCNIWCKADILDLNQAIYTETKEKSFSMRYMGEKHNSHVYFNVK